MFHSSKGEKNVLILNIHFYHVSISGCDSKDEYTGPWGIITSPGYPENYENNLDCSYNITLDGRIRLTFTDVDIENGTRCGYDSLKVT